MLNNTANLMGVCGRAGQYGQNIYHDIYLSICNNDTINVSQNTLQLQNIIVPQKKPHQLMNLL